MAFAVFVHLIARLAVVLLPIAVDDSDASSPSQANAESNAGTNCAWDCNIIDPKFGLEMKVLISEYKIVTVQLKYEQQEEKQCSHLTDLKRNSSLAGFWIWQTCNIPSHGGQNMSQHSFNKSNNWFQKSLEGQIEVGVSCSFSHALIFLTYRYMLLILGITQLQNSQQWLIPQKIKGWQQTPRNKVM